MSQPVHGQPDFLNLTVDHMTLLVQPELYNVLYVLFRVIFGCGPEDILYEKRREWAPGQGEQSMTFGARIGSGPEPRPELNNTIIAVVQPTEPGGQPSHVREMLDGHRAAAHWQHIALRTSDLFGFHEYAQARGMRFITPILRDEGEDLLQVFSGEFFVPDMPPSGLFFEFVQRGVTPELTARLAERDRQAWFRDRTFLGLYDKKECEYRTGRVTPLIDFDLFELLRVRVGRKRQWEITAEDVAECEDAMLDYVQSTTRRFA